MICSQFLACDPKLMPTFPQHRNIKGSKTSAPPDNANTGAGDQTNNLPAISDLVSCLNFKELSLRCFIYCSWVPL
jgi:hypothetical protein